MQEVFAEDDGIAVIEVFDVLADGAARTAGNGEIEPGGVGFGVFGGDDFHRIAGFELGTQRHHGVVDAGGDGFVADVGMDGIGEVYGCGTFGQGEDFAFRGKDVDFVGEQVDFDVFQKFDGVRTTGLQVEDVFQPLVGMEYGLVYGVFAGFVNPVARNASFGDGIHFACADLNFDG